MIIVEMKRHFQLRAIEWYSAGALASWGFVVLLLPTIFAENPSMGYMSYLAPQQVWGLAALTAGCLRLCALFVNGLWYRTPAVRWLTTMVSIFIWFAITAALVKSPIANTGIAIYGWHILADMYSAFRSASDYIEAETQRKLKKLAADPVAEGRSRTNVRSITPR